MDMRKEVGRFGETVAASFLEKQGVRILKRNFQCRFGEIDLIGREKDYLIIVEVKLRRDRQKGMPGEAVDKRKQKKICQTFNYYRMKEKITDFVPVRFDVVEVYRDLSCHWIRNAFEYLE